MANVVINPDKTISIDGKKTFPLLMWGVSNWWNTKTGVPGYIPESGQVSISKLKNAFDVSVDSGVVNDGNIHELEGMYYVGNPRNTNYSSPRYFGTMNWQEPDMAGQWYFKGICAGVDVQPVGNIACSHTEIGKIYNKLKSESPLPVIQAIMGVRGYSSLKFWQDVSDILIDDVYSYENYNSIKSGKTRDKVAFWYELELFDHCLWDIGGNIASLKNPVIHNLNAIGIQVGTWWKLTAQEVREMVYLAITTDCQGLCFWGYKINMWSTLQAGLVVSPSELQIYINQALEIKTLNDILVLPTECNRWMKYKSNDIVTMTGTYNTTFTYYGSPQSHSNFNWILKNDAQTGMKYLIVVNKGDRPISTAISISSITNADIQTIGTQTAGSGAAGRTSQIIGGVFNDTFDAHTVHIYQIGSVSPPPVPLTVTTTVSGPGRVQIVNKTTGFVANINSSYSMEVDSGTIVEWAAIPDAGAQFDGFYLPGYGGTADKVYSAVITTNAEMQVNFGLLPEPPIPQNETGKMFMVIGGSLLLREILK